MLERALRGLPAKQIASDLGLSPHTVHDHFKAIYRKTGVTGSDELMAGLSAPIVTDGYAAEVGC